MSSDDMIVAEVSAPVSASAETSGAVSETEAAPKPSRARRTRAAKAASPETTADAAPREDRAGDADSAQASDVSVEEKTTPKTRRAPRKKAASAKEEAAASEASAASVDSAMPESTASDSAAPESDPDAAQPAAPKRAARTRTRKSSAKADSAPASSVKGVADAAGATTGAEADASSRASSSEVSESESPATEHASSDADAPEGERKPARRTRSTRNRPKGDAATGADSDAEASGAEGENRDSKPARERAERSERSERTERADRGDRNDRSDRGDKGERSERSERYDRERRDRNRNDRDRNDRSDRDRNDRGKGGNRQNDKGKQQRDQQANQQHRRQRRSHTGGVNREPVMPKTTAEDLNALKVAELRVKAEELGVESKGLKKAELVERVLEASVRAEGFVEVEGILDILQDGYGFLRTSGYLPGESDVYVGLSLIRRNGLRKGDYIRGQVRPKRDNEKFAALQSIATVNDVPLEELGHRVRFGDLTPIYPDDCLIMEHGKSTITARVIDLVAPIGKGQRGLIVSPPKAGKTTVLKDIAAAITANNPEVHLMCLLVDERPEEVTDMQRSISGEVISSTFDMPTENHIAVSELVIERAKRLVECGKDVVVLLDSLTRLARAYNLAQPASGRILSGGVDSTALYPPKRFLGAARNIEGGGSLTILASALIETGSKMDEVIFEEFKGTGNMELKLDRNLADRRIFPAIDPVASGTRKEDLLLNPQEAPLIWAVRRILSNMNNTERAMDMLIKSLKQTNNNQEFLLRTAKKAQGNRDSDNFEF